MKIQQKQYDDDDGGITCNMEVPGMRWHDINVRCENNVKRKIAQGNQLSRSEAMRFTWYSGLS